MLINNPKQLLDYMTANFEFGYASKGKTFYDDDFAVMEKHYKLSSPKQLEISQLGVCWDFVEFEREFFANHKYSFSTYAIVGDEGPLHTFIVYEKLGKFYHFEYAWGYYKGIHEFVSLKDLLHTAFEIMQKFRKEKNNTFINPRIYKYNKPQYDISFIEFKKHILSSKCIS